MSIETGPLKGFLNFTPINRRFTGHRIFLRRFSTSDSDSLLCLLKRNRSWLEPWMPEIPTDLKRVDLKRTILKEHSLMREGTRLTMGIFSLDSEVLIGSIVLHSVHWGILMSGGLGYWIDEKMGGKGLMKEAIATFVSFIFEEAALNRIWAGVQLNNFKSKRLLEVMGFTFEGIHRQEIFISSGWRDQYHFRILREEYDLIAETWLESAWLGTRSP